MRRLMTPQNGPGRRLLNTALALAISLATIVWVCERPAIAADAPTGASQRTLVVLGDSISAEYGLPRGTGWVALLQKRLPDWKVVNASISGETTAGGRTRIARLLSKHQPDLLLLELGGNDALRGLDLNSSAANLDKISGLAREQGAQVVVLGMRVPPNYGRAYTEKFAAIFKQTAEQHQAELVPFLLSEIVGGENSFQADGIHPTSQVQETLLNTAWPAIERALNKTDAGSAAPR